MTEDDAIGAKSRRRVGMTDERDTLRYIEAA